MVLATLGLLRLPDVYSRISALTKGATFGIISVSLAAFLYFWLDQGMFSGKILLTIVFVFLTAPVTEFVVSRSAYHTGAPLAKSNMMDDLRVDIEKKRKEQKVQNEQEEQT
ncbi:multicomponent Na+:H+ antiporter subunit G [Bacillus horti]|uniref:Multicomponent Na+:H+ antiporter subunit G n=2 Tax=Caldalkalibacillus horti TaxID=77523 RepID=A0ABT9VXN4_9BACI|nr:multicomponent Na+:H+ antiporter subunit G [Bacillus horti]